MKMRVSALRGWSRRTVAIAAVVVIALGAGGGAVLARLGAATPSASGNIDLQKGLVGWWKFDGNAKDSTPYGNNGTVNGATLTTDRKGKTNSAYSFNGSGNYIDTGHMYSLDTFTFSLWVYQTKSGAYQTPLSDTRDCCGTGYHGFDFETSYTSNNVELKLWGSAGTVVAQVTGVNTDLNTWDFFAGSFDGSNLKLYKNGALVGTSSAYSGTVGPATSDLMMGRAGAVNGGQFGGSIDDVRLYNRALSDNAVAALYKQYGSGIETDNGENSLVGWWKLNGNTKDTTPYARNGTAYGSPPSVADRKGTSRGAYSFNGTNQYIQIADADQFSPSAEGYSFAVSMWAMIPTNAPSLGDGACGGTGAYMISKGASGQYEWGLENDDNNLLCVNTWQLNGVPTDGTLQVAKTLNDGKWHHYAVVIGAGNVQLYVDGVAVGGTPLSHIMGNGTAPVIIGSRDGTSNFMFSGSIADVRIYDRALSNSDITSQYNSYNSQISLGGSSSSGAINLRKGLVGYWPMNGYSKDATPYSNDMVASGNPGPVLTADRKGRANSAFSFNGSTGKLVTSTTNGMDVSNLTVAAWVYATADVPFQDAVARWQGTPLANGYWQLEEGNSGQWGFTVYMNNANRVVSTSTGFSLNQWHYLVGTYDGTTENLYVDGSLAATQAAAYGSLPGGAPALGIGSMSSGASRWTGSIDDVRIYNRAINAAEVAALYNEYQ